ncbi:hypothetical protein SOVF_216770 [Spinacia oleracea]|nr:hypothetical protein SOVF_216770 [Spinacia oleracea]
MLTKGFGGGDSRGGFTGPASQKNYVGYTHENLGGGGRDGEIAEVQRGPSGGKSTRVVVKKGGVDKGRAGAVLAGGHCGGFATGAMEYPVNFMANYSSCRYILGDITKGKGKGKGSVVNSQIGHTTHEVSWGAYAWEES